MEDHYTRFVDAFENTRLTNAGYDIDWQKELKKWIAAAKNDESILFLAEVMKPIILIIKKDELKSSEINYILQRNLQS